MIEIQTKTLTKLDWDWDKKENLTVPVDGFMTCTGVGTDKFECDLSLRRDDGFDDIFDLGIFDAVEIDTGKVSSLMEKRDTVNYLFKQDYCCVKDFDISPDNIEIETLKCKVGICKEP